MARVVKKVSGPYVIEAHSGTPTQMAIGAVSRNDATLTVHGNLVVRGTSTSIQSTDTYIADNRLTLSKGLDPVVAAASNIKTGIEVDRGELPNVSILWNESTKKWSLTNDGVNFTNIATSQYGDYLTAVIEDPAPVLGGNLDTNTKTITSTTNVVIAPTGNTQVDSVLQIKKGATAPTADVPGYTLIQAKDTGGGGSGLYVTNTAEIDQELITKKRAIVYSLIF